MSEYRIENLKTYDGEIFDTLDECRDYVGNDDYLNYAIYEIVHGDSEFELNQDILIDYVGSKR